MNRERSQSRREAYRKKLRDPRWQKKRLEVFNRDKFRCQFCGDHTETLHVHHLYYEQDFEPWDYPMDALTTVCELCHEDEHNNRPEAERQFIDVLRWTGFSVSDLVGLTLTIQNSTFMCAKREFVEFLDWVMMDNMDRFVRQYYPAGLSSEREPDTEEPL